MLHLQSINGGHVNSQITVRIRASGEPLAVWQGTVNNQLTDLTGACRPVEFVGIVWLTLFEDPFLLFNGTPQRLSAQAATRDFVQQVESKMSKRNRAATVPHDATIYIRGLSGRRLHTKRQFAQDD